MCGIPEDEFWAMSPAEFERRQWAYFKSLEDRQRELISIGWWSAAMSRQNRLPSLKILLHPARNPNAEEKQALEEYHRRVSQEMGD